MTEPFEPINTVAGPGEAKANAQTLARILSEVFPEAVTESGIDFEALKQLVGEEALPSTAEKFGLSWPGKAASRRLALLPPTGTLLPRPEESVEWDATKNIVIEGDNLEVLRLLRRGYAGKVDVIYIDPPYNTGSDLVYHDSRVTPKDEFETQVGERDGEGRLVKNTDASGRRHAAWLDMMHPRLWAARDLLKDTGVVIAAIGDDEHAHLRMLLEQVFGAENFISDVVWQGGRKNDSRYVSNGADYMLIYAKNEAILAANSVRWRERKPGVQEALEMAQHIWDEENADHANAQKRWRKWLKEFKASGVPTDAVTRYTTLDGTGRPVRNDGNISWPGGGGPRYDVLHPVTKKPVVVPAPGWRYPDPATMQREILAGNVAFGVDHTTQPGMVNRLEELDRQVAVSVFERDRNVATVALNTLFDGNAPFTAPKDVNVLARWIDLVSSGNRDAVVLDFFAGSGSTGHAVMDLNVADGGDRQYVLVQLDESVDHPEYTTIADITRERLRRAGKAIADTQGLNAGDLDLGFRAYRLAESNTRKWDGTTGEQSLEDAVASAVDNLLPGRTTDDLLVEMMLRLGLELTTPVEQQDVAGSPLYNLGAGTMFAYFGTDITVEESKQIAQAIRTWRDEEGPVTEAAVVVRDTGFADSAAKLNLAAALNQAGITNLRSI
ncbi:site-specific DNA-methyltransferase [Isoptericola sp. F-RaC21]|uniref:site-specific DNA-methyltransferase n=1 Tax=Isoptericola sp. F-RaC21 TaxID=3141452 RepID=UPI00315C1305